MGKGLNDVIHGDRSVVRANQFRGGGGGGKRSKWDSFYDDDPTQSDLLVRDRKKTNFLDVVSNGAPCYESHPALKLPGAELVIYGGSCLHPIVKDADVYIGFDEGMKLTERCWPWKDGYEVRFKIRDMCAPDKVGEFRNLVLWTQEMLAAGKKVHAGCIGGHGRTGTFLAALVSMYGEKDAITYVRQHYCKRAVESAEQIKFLAREFGVTVVAGSKEKVAHAGSSGGSSQPMLKPGKETSWSKGKPKSERFTAVAGNGTIWS